MLIIFKYAKFILCSLGFIFINAWRIISNYRLNKRLKYEQERGANFARAVEKVDEMDDDDLIALFKRMSKRPPKH